MDKNGPILDIGVGYASVERTIKTALFLEQKKFIGFPFHFSVGYKFRKFIVSVTSTSGTLNYYEGNSDEPTDSMKINSLGGFLNFDGLIGDRDAFGIFGLGVANYGLQYKDEKMFDGGLVLRSGFGSAVPLWYEDGYLLSTVLVKVGLGDMKYEFKSFPRVDIRLSNFFAFESSFGIAF